MALGIVSKQKTELTVDKMKDMFPQRKGTITQETVDLLNAANGDPSFNGDEFVENLISYRDIMLNNSYSMKDFITAMKFCAYLEAEGDNYTEAYKRARGDDEFVKERVGAPSGSKAYNELSSTASRYRKSMIVRKILTAADMPLYLMFQGARYKAVAVLEREMQSAAYSKDRISAADKLLTHVKPPDNLQVELEVGPNQEAKDLSKQISEQLAHSVAMQKQLIAAGVPLEEAQRLGLKEDVIDVETN